MSAGEGDAGRGRPRTGRGPRGNGTPHDGDAPVPRKRAAAARAKANGAPAKRAGGGRARRPRPEEAARLADEPAVALDAAGAEAAEAELDSEPADVAAFFGEDTDDEDRLAADALAGDRAAQGGREPPPAHEPPADVAAEAEEADLPREVGDGEDEAETVPAAPAKGAAAEQPRTEAGAEVAPAAGRRAIDVPEAPARDRYRVPTPVRPVPNPRRPRAGAGFGPNARWLGREVRYRARLVGYGLWRAAHWLGEHRGVSAALVGIAISLLVTWIRFSERYDDFIATALDSWPWAVLLFAINAGLTVLLIRLFTRLVDAQRTIGYAVIVAIGFQGIIASDIKLEPIAGNDVPGQEPLNVGRLYEPIEGHISAQIDDDVNAARDGEIRVLAGKWRGPRGPRELTQTIAGMVDTSVMDPEERTEVTEGMATILGREGPCAPAERVRRIGVLLYGNSARDFVQEAIRRAPAVTLRDAAASEERAARRCEQRRAAARRARAVAARRRAARQQRTDRGAATRSGEPAPGAAPGVAPASEAGL